jgi:hypothetical protein
MLKKNYIKLNGNEKLCIFLIHLWFNIYKLTRLKLALMLAVHLIEW